MGKIKAGVSKAQKPAIPAKTSYPGRRVGLRRTNSSAAGAASASAIVSASAGASASDEISAPEKEEDVESSEEDFSEDESSFSESDMSSNEEETTSRKRKVPVGNAKKGVKKSEFARKKDDLGSALRRNLDTEGLFKFHSYSTYISLNYCSFIGLQKSPEVLVPRKSLPVPASSKPVAAIVPSNSGTNTPLIQGNAFTPVSQNVERRIAITSGISCLQLIAKYVFRQS